MVVHCSAGVGRTGVLIAIDIGMDRAAATGTVDVRGTINELRRQRSTMTQNAEQYMLVYRALSDYFSGMRRAV